MTDRPDTTTIEVTAEVAHLVAEAVDAGDYGSASDAIRDALLLHRSRQDTVLGYTMDELRRLGDEGEASGPGGMTLEEIQHEGLARADVVARRA